MKWKRAVHELKKNICILLYSYKITSYQTVVGSYFILFVKCRDIKMQETEDACWSGCTGEIK